MAQTKDIVDRLRNVLSDEDGVYDEAPLGLCESAAVEIERLRAIVDKLPKTEDGASVTHGDVVWLDDGREARVVASAEFDPTNVCVAFHWEACPVITGPDGWTLSAASGADADCCFSTKEAAEQARKEREDAQNPHE